ncbi:MAG: GNAT family N-acetyltransferase [Wujia sp.]
MKLFKNLFVKQSKQEITFAMKSTTDLSKQELEECSDLFSSFYGKYSKASNKRPGEQVKLSSSYYKRNYCKPGFFVALARSNGKLVGQAFYIRKSYESYGVMTWVLQLVVDKNYRKQGIASTLLRSIWGFSDDFAWGLATANPCTVRTLESATFRKCKPTVIRKNLRAVKLIGNDTGFVNEQKYYVTNSASQVNTGFFVDNSEFEINEDTCDKYLGTLKPGYEWLAFTFQSQSIQLEKYKKHFEDTVAFSEKILRETYSRMDVVSHAWAKGTPNEVDFLQTYCEKGSLLDLGCGIGRHSLQFAELGYDVCGVDFSDKHIAYAKEELQKLNSERKKCRFVCDDVRTFQDDKQYDNVICLYDVVGSFPAEDDNESIIKTAHRHLKKDGVFVLSVMNMELTTQIVPEDKQADLREHPEILLKLKPSQIMQKTGDIFDPEYLAIDTRSKLVYRKEQFSNDSSLSAEYVIRDKRYTMEEAENLLQKFQFEILEKRYVRAGHFDEALGALDLHAKEILIIARKK